MRDRNPLKGTIPEEDFQRIALATALGKLSVTAILTTDMIGRLQKGEAALLDLQDGSAILLIPESLVRDVYQK